MFSEKNTPPPLSKIENCVQKVLKRGYKLARCSEFFLFSSKLQIVFGVISSEELG